MRPQGVDDPPPQYAREQVARHFQIVGDPVMPVEPGPLYRIEVSQFTRKHLIFLTIAPGRVEEHHSFPNRHPCLLRSVACFRMRSSIRRGTCNHQVSLSRSLPGRNSQRADWFHDYQRPLARSQPGDGCVGAVPGWIGSNGFHRRGADVH